MGDLKLSRRRFRIRSAWICWICCEYASADTPSPTPPEGWRSTRRGYAGIVFICPACNAAGRRHRK